MGWHKGLWGGPRTWHPEKGDRVRVVDGPNDGRVGVVVEQIDYEFEDALIMHVTVKVEPCGCVITVDYFDVEADDDPT